MRSSIAFPRCIQTPYPLANVTETLNLVDGRLPPDSCFPVIFGGFVVEGLGVADCPGSYRFRMSSAIFIQSVSPPPVRTQFLGQISVSQCPETRNGL